MFAAMFLFGSIGFWLLTAAAMLLLILLVEFEKSGWAFLTLVGTGGLLLLGGNVGILPWIVANPFLMVAFLIGYVLIGAGWSLFKWFLFVTDRKEKFIEEKSRRRGETLLRLKSHLNREPSKEEVNAEILASIKNNHRKMFGMPVPSEHKSRIMHWMAYWPWSVINSLIFDFIRRFFKHVYNALADVFRKISEYVYKDIKAEIGVDSEW